MNTQRSIGSFLAVFALALVPSAAFAQAPTIGSVSVSVTSRNAAAYGQLQQHASSLSAQLEAHNAQTRSFNAGSRTDAYTHFAQALGRGRIVEALGLGEGLDGVGGERVRPDVAVVIGRVPVAGEDVAEVRRAVLDAWASTALAEHRLALHGWVFDLADGSLRVYDAVQEEFVTPTASRPEGKQPQRTSLSG